MGTDALWSRDAYARSVMGVVAMSEPADDGACLVTLDRTVFYPGGGGQPADTGWLVRAGQAVARWSVRGARKSGDAIIHDVSLADWEAGTGSGAGTGAGRLPPPIVGEPLLAELDWGRRHLLMRTHTALHALCGVVWRDHGAQVTGGNMEPGRGRMDFEFEKLDAALAASIEATVNAELRKARPIQVRFLPRDEAFAIPDLIRTKVNLLPQGISEVRIVDIEGLDLQADGGTHVANTSEVGLIHITGYESKGRSNKRIRLELVDP